MSKKIFLLFFFITTNLVQTVNAQSVQIFTSSTLNGALNGITLGAASMFVTNAKVNAPFNKNLDDLYPIQLGLGLGTLYGIGLGAYDVVSGEGRNILVSGFFNDGKNSSIIVLMDTFYGAATGGLIAMSLSLVVKEPLFDVAKYGIGLGAFVGFGFGIIDISVLAERSSEPVSMQNTSSTIAGGLASISFKNGTSIGVLNPSIFNNLELTSTRFSRKYNPSVDLINLKFNF